jgi:hypothetical protein
MSGLPQKRGRYTVDAEEMKIEQLLMQPQKNRAMTAVGKKSFNKEIGEPDW